MTETGCYQQAKVLYCDTISGLLWIRQDSMMLEVHAEVRLASLKSRKKIVANDENYALAA
jgi:hypothetical protein